MNRIIQIAINRPISVLMLTIALVLFGWRALQNLETALLPDIEYPEFFILTEFPGGSPAEIEKHITIPLEEVLSSLPGIQDVVSQSREGLSVVEAQFNWNIDFQFTLLRIREKIDAVRSQFPVGTKRPYILDFNPTSAPIMELVVSRDNTNLATLSEFVADVLQPRFAQLEGIASAQMTGAPQSYIQIQLMPEKLVQYRLPISRVIQSIRNNIPEGILSSRVMVGYEEFPLNIEVQLEKMDDFLEMPVALSDTSFITLSRIAHITKAPLPRRSLTYFNESQVIGLLIYKESGANTVQATNNAINLIQSLKKEYPDIHIKIIKNQGAFVRQAIQSLQQALVLGAFLAFLVLLLFLRDFRISTILAAVIPVSLLVTCLALYLQNISLNIMSLGGLALGIGLIVDNGIIVTESISRELERKNISNPVFSGTTKVSRAIVGATLTTIAIFFPIIYVRGYAAVLFKHQALSITYTLLVSLFAALTLLPTAIHALIVKQRQKRDLIYSDQTFFPEGKWYQFLSRTFWSTTRKIRLLFQRLCLQPMERINRLSHPVVNYFNSVYTKSESLYHKALIRTLDNKPLAGIIAIGLILLTILLFTLVPQQYWPDVSSRYVELEVKVPLTMPFLQLQAKTEQSLQNLTRLDIIESVLTQIIDPTTAQGSAYQQAIHQAGFYSVKFLIVLKKPINNPDNIRRQLLEQIKLPIEHGELRIVGNLQEEFVFSEKKNFIVYFSGEQFDKVHRLAQDNVTFLQKLSDCQNVSLEYGGGETIQIVRPRQSALTRFQLTPDQISTLLTQQLRGEAVGNWQQGNRSIPIILIWDKPTPKTLTELLSYSESNRHYHVPVEKLISVKKDIQKREIIRVNRKRVIAVEAHVAPHRLISIVKKEKQWLRQHQLPGIEATIAGESQRIAQSFHELRLAFLFAVIIVYLILAAQFESLIHPVNILFTVPMGVIGALFGLLIFNQSLNVISLIGMVMLIGIGVNDAIVKVDYMNYLRKNQNKSLREAVLITSQEKFRPVLMTSLTTIVAMMPMLFGLGGNTEFNRPLAATIVGGLSFTTILTLIYTPILYELFEKIGSLFKRGEK